jgi:ATP-binding cassette subfamily B protein
MHADEILFLEEGKIVERGTHKELLDLGGRYAELHSLQMGAADSVEPTLAQVSPG